MPKGQSNLFELIKRRQRDRERAQTPERKAWRREYCKRWLNRGNNKDKHRLLTQANKKKESCKVKEWQRVIRNRFGLTSEQYYAMLDSQNGGCAVCGTHVPGGRSKNKKRFHIDHDHRTGAIRGLLCLRCNLLLGHLTDTADGVESWARMAVSYLTKHKPRMAINAGIQDRDTVPG